MSIYIFLVYGGGEREETESQEFDVWHCLYKMVAILKKNANKKIIKHQH